MSLILDPFTLFVFDLFEEALQAGLVAVCLEALDVENHALGPTYGSSLHYRTI